MSKRYEEYQICRKRKHQKSGRTTMHEGSLWDLCDFCGTGFRYITELKEAGRPNKDE